MSVYQAPIEDMRFVMDEIANLSDVTALPGYDEISPDLIDAILEEAGKTASEILAPINRRGDEQGCVFENGIVRTPDGFKEAYHQFVEMGWNGMPFETEFGGQGLPWLATTAVTEMVQAANMSFGLCPLLTQGAVELLSAHGSDELKSIYLEKMVSGEWNGTMNLTEPQAGSDLSRIRTKAEKDGDHFRISGSKLFITYGEHDFTDNIIHLVLARLPDAPEGIRGISLFVVPKYLVNDDGSLGARNDLRCVSIEHKLGINASPTAVMSFGDNDGAIGYLVGEPNQGIKCMFTMMNNARLNVGLQGIGIAERAYQQARDYALDRVQSRELGSDDPNPVSIIRHPDVKRMLLSMKAQTEATRALAYYVASHLDIAKRHEDATARLEAQSVVDLLTPIVKAWSSDTGIEVANTGVQVHGGMGFIEESGAPQHLRDARITAIYEGTNGIQANDLVGRKIAYDEGAALRTLLETITKSADDMDSEDPAIGTMTEALLSSTQVLEDVGNWIVSTYKSAPNDVAAGAVPFLRLMGLVCGGWLMVKGAAGARRKLDQSDGNPDFLRMKIVTARFFVEHLLVQCASLGEIVTDGGSTITNVDETSFT
jgi:alkylation response protein AidB-like acyl-CoA dehydrogenase